MIGHAPLSDAFLESVFFISVLLGIRPVLFLFLSLSLKSESECELPSLSTPAGVMRDRLFTWEK